MAQEPHAARVIDLYGLYLVVRYKQFFLTWIYIFKNINYKEFSKNVIKGLSDFKSLNRSSNSVDKYSNLYK